MSLTRLLLIVAVSMSLACAEPAVAAPEELSIGSTAPPLDIDHWFDFDAEEPAAPITAFESDKVYVVEFWATWCGPCVMAIPHVADLQEKYRDAGLTVISVSDEDTETIEPFFEREVRGYDGPEDEVPTYGKLMSTYRVGSDGDGSVSEDYMRAAGQNGIPCAFLVGKTGLIEWIGHPMSIDGPLDAVVNDTWDREAFLEQTRLRKQMEARVGEAMAALRAGDAEKCREILQSLTTLSDEPAFQAQIAGMLEQIEFRIYFTQLGEDPAADLAGLKKIAGKYEGEIEAVNSVAWQLYQLAAGGKEIDPQVMQTAIDLLEAEMQEGQREGSALDTIGHLYHQMGELDKAIDYQRRALADDQVPEDEDLRAAIEAFLEQLLAEQAGPGDTTE